MDVPAPGVGAVCGPCPDGYFDDGEKCAGNATPYTIFTANPSRPYMI